MGQAAREEPEPRPSAVPLPLILALLPLPPLLGTKEGSPRPRSQLSADRLSCPTGAETRQRLLRTVKKEVKQIMEEAVTRKFVHEDSSHIISFCAAVEACVLHGLRRRAAGFLRSNKIAALFMKVGKSFPPADELSRKVQDLEQLIENARNQIQGLQENVRKLPKLPNLSPLAIKHLWIRTALFEKVLDKIVHYLVENSSKYYEKEALLMDPVDGPILASLLVGPCALEYTKMKTADHFWTDPSADELVQRHRIHSSHLRQDSPTKRPALCIQKRLSSGSMDDRPSLSARDYVESLHQNSRATLLYGKNNVLVQPRDDMEAVPGYLSLHQTADLMTLKWTPNQLMNGSVGDLDYEKSVYWDYAMTIRLEEIVYLHCHQQVDSGGTVVLVSQDGIQRPPFHFPKGGHLLQFLSCLENGLLPHGQLDPPLWSQRGKGKVFPKLRKRSPQGSAESTASDKEDDEATDYVFRIIYPSLQSEFVVPDPLGSTSSVSMGPAWMVVPVGRTMLVVARGSRWAQTRWDATLPIPGLKQQPPMPQDLMDVSMSNLPSLWQPSTHKSSCSSCSQSSSGDGGSTNGCKHERAPLKLLCDNMKYQILSRAFYGWLAYCRHLSTVRTHLSALVNHMIVSPDLPCDAGHGLTAGIWEQYLQDSTSYEEQELLRLIYYGGIQPEIRKAVWPFLLGHYQFGMTETERKEVDEQIHACYAQTMSEWLGCEAIVRQRERESHAAALAKCSSGASLEGPLHRMMHRDSTISNESSQSCSSGHQNIRLQSDSSSSTQVTFPRPRRGPGEGWGAGPQRQGRNGLERQAVGVHTEPLCLCRSYIWQHIEIGYVQGMCDLLAPLLVILDDEALTFSCFTELMKRMNQNFPHGGAMDTHFANMRSLIQILDSELFELMHQNGDYTHFYFCYRWFLLDFKRELVYDDVFSVWETIWAAKHVSSTHYVLFIALALVEVYRDIILENNMDFTDIIKFFNEMAERHNTKQILKLARDLVYKVQTLIENK
ncbi:PREDICTED: small G protein signaling modulator 1 [Myotis davidii]|uniref:small G protein signaling modulator 1 n=1 Tax=Myotis davidii TaxID=225400 RepID=UPI000767D957|nr:PREDICTED: small G protein signaling modulator 1 [Myotis davidii]